jgi:hypothetical protein
MWHPPGCQSPARPTALPPGSQSKWHLISDLVSLLVKWIIALIDGLAGFEDSAAFASFPFWGARSRICIWLATTSTTMRCSPSGLFRLRVCNWSLS